MLEDTYYKGNVISGSLIYEPEMVTVCCICSVHFYGNHFDSLGGVFMSIGCTQPIIKLCLFPQN